MAYRLKSIVKGSLLYTSGQVLTKASAFLLIPLYTRFLSPNDYGIIGYLQFLLEILSTILMFGFYGAQTRFFFQHKNENTVIGEYLFSINLWLLSILFPAVLLTVFGGEYLYRAIGPDEIPFDPYIPVIAWTVLFQVMNQLVISYWMVRKEYLKTTLLQLLLFALTTGFAIFLVVGLKMGAEGKVKGMLYGQAAFFVLSYFPYAKHFIFRVKWSYLAFSLGFGLPIVVHLLSGVIHNSVDRALLADMVSVADLGLYTLGYQVGMVMAIVTASVNRAWQPSYYDLMQSDAADKDFQIQRTYNLWLMVMSAICIVGILWGDVILCLLTPSEFHGAGRIIPFVLFGYFFHGLYYFASAPIFFYKKTTLLPWLTGSAAALNIFLNLLFIPHLGITGAALATTVSMFFHASFSYAIGKRLYDHGFDLLATGAIATTMLLALISLQLMEKSPMSHLYRLVFLLLFLAVVSGLFNKDLHRVIFAIKKEYIYKA